jgi:hypothetical protein
LNSLEEDFSEEENEQIIELANIGDDYYQAYLDDDEQAMLTSKK